MKIKMNLMENKITATDVEGEQVNKVIDGFFSVLHATLAHTAPKPEPVEAPKQKPININVEVPATVGFKPTPVYPKPQKFVAPAKLASEPKQEPTTEPVSKKLPKIDNERSMTTPIEELISFQQNIKEIADGILLYQTHYTCDCGHHGKRFIRNTNDYTKCHSCQAKLVVEPATLENDGKGIPVPDSFGNFFIARELYETEEN